MKVPNELRVYCPRCHMHTPHGVSLYKKGRERAMAIGARRHEREKHGYGGQKWPMQKKTAKTTKKQLLKLTCKTCSYVIYRLGIRLRKLEVGG